MRDRTEADDIVQGAGNRALLELILPLMRTAVGEDHKQLDISSVMPTLSEKKSTGDAPFESPWWALPGRGALG